jgi:hypothetical protein
MRPYVSAFMVLAMCSLAGPAMSQQAHQHPQSPVIDGSVHPELIPDLTAYRLWFVSVSRGPNSTDAEMKHQAAQLNRALLGAQDQKIVIGLTVLTTNNALMEMPPRSAARGLYMLIRLRPVHFPG